MPTARLFSSWPAAWVGRSATWPLTRFSLGGTTTFSPASESSRSIATGPTGPRSAVRVKELRRICLGALADSGTTPTEADRLRRDLADLFVVVQLFSYPGDYVRDCPTLERVAETLTKLEEDALGNQAARPCGPRRAILQLGPPIDVAEHLAKAGGKLRRVGPALTAELEGRMQDLLDTIGPGRPLPPATPSSAEPQLHDTSVPV